MSYALAMALSGVVIGWLGLPRPVQAAKFRCAPDSVPVGNVCVDKYEASVWEVPFMPLPWQG
jgi:hypothetical protein